MPDNGNASIQVRARAVDMLGRQQIAGIPTAIHELFKNAYDAFAQRVEVDVLMKERAFILRDDGYGMTEDDFRNRWLTLGTESRYGTKTSTAPWMGNYGNTERRIMGEKGIGRLAIASIGPVVLAITRAKRPENEGGLHDTVVSLIHWGLFEQPGIDIGQIRIPIRVIPGGTLPDRTLLDELVTLIRQNVSKLAHQLDASFTSKLEQDLASMAFSPAAVLAARGEPSLSGDGCGTCFIIRPYETILDADIFDSSLDNPGRLQKMLIGFGNTMLPDEVPPPIKTAFRLHKADGECDDIIDDKEFFTPAEYQTSDHIIEGEFDDHGQFTGSVKIFDREPVSYTLNWSGGAGTPSRCGSFRIKFGYMMGQAHESLLSPDDFTNISKRLDRFGGLYIYKDGIRVLPYGDVDYDFLHIERRRTLKAADWFFSHRRLFGAILVSSANAELQEKAGREGFQENHAYRQFRSMLVNLFESLAKDFFRKDAPLGEDFNRKKEEMRERKRVLDLHKKKAKAKKEKFSGELTNFFDQVETGAPSVKIEHLLADIDRRFDNLTQLNDPDQLGKTLFKLECESREKLERLRRTFIVRRPSGIGLNKQLTAEWQAYQRVFGELEAACFRKASAHLDERLSEVLRQRSAALDRRRVLREALDTSANRVKALAQSKKREVQEGISESRQVLLSGVKNSIQRLHENVQLALSDFEKTDISQMPSEQVVEFRAGLERRIEDSADLETSFLSKIREQLDSLASAVDDGNMPDDVVAALEDDNEAIQEENETALEWAQIGMALGIVQHEFIGSTAKIKKAIKQLRPWAAETPGLRELFKNLTNGFSTLEEYLRLFTPLDRRLQRQRVNLPGEEIYSYIIDVFSERLERHSFHLEASDEFRKSSLHTFPSTIFPVFINLVDNACYWMRENGVENGCIRLDASEDGWIIVNSGPGIETKLADRIFDFGFSTKRGGRGMGLTISRRALKREGMELSLQAPGAKNEACFMIRFPESDNNGAKEGQ
jgi:signal transduction histidine kinase